MNDHIRRALGAIEQAKEALGKAQSALTCELENDMYIHKDIANTSLIPATTAPLGAPTNLTGSVYSETDLELFWNVSTDTNVTGYRISRDGVVLGDLPGIATNSFTDDSLTAGTAYSYGVQAFDASGNLSTAVTISLTTNAAPVSITGTVALSHDGNGVTTITATISQNAPIEIYWRIAGAATFNAHSSSVDDSSTNTHSVTINTTQGLTIEAYATDHIGNTYTTPTESISVPAQSSNSFFKGQAFGSWSLANGEVGGAGNRKTSAMFTAKKSGTIDQVRQYFIFTTAASSGYHAGTGGIIKLDIVNDNNGIPGTTVFATGQLTADLLGPNRISINTPVQMTSISNLVAGTKYHMVYSNIDASPTTNWLCIDGMWGELGHQHHWGVPVDSGPYSYSFDGVTWSDSTHSHIYQIDYTSGEYEGFGIYGGYGLSTQFSIGGVNQSRQVCKFDVDNEIQNAWVRCGRRSGGGTAPLTLTIYNSAGTVMAQDSVPYTSVPEQLDKSNPAHNSPNRPTEHDWVEFSGINGFTALASDTYYATLSAAAGSDYRSYPMKTGKFYGFGNDTFGWGGEIAQISTNSGSSWTGISYDGNVKSDSEMSIFFNKGY